MKKTPGNVIIRETEDGKQMIEIRLSQQDIVAILENFAVHLLGEGNMEPEEAKDVLNRLTGEQSALDFLIDQAVDNAVKITEKPVSGQLS